MIWIDWTLFAPIFLVAIAGCILATLATEHYYARWERRRVRGREAEIEYQKEVLDKRAALLDSRFKTVVSLERDLSQRAKKTSQTIRDESQHFDTMISEADFDDLPHPNEMADTVSLLAIEDER